MEQSNSISEAVSCAVQGMNKLDLLLLYLKIQDGMTNKELIEITGMSQDRLTRRLRGIFSRIREELNDSDS